MILNALEALYVGALCVLMAPNAFMQRPLNWLRAISQYRAEVASSPNFGYDLCVSRYRAEQMQDVDLSSWRHAMIGAEPVRADTITSFVETFAGHGFDPRTMFPAYGMAEATLLISGGQSGAGHVTRAVSRSGPAGAQGRRTGRIRRCPDAGRLWPGADQRADRDRRSRFRHTACARSGWRSLGERAERRPRLLAKCRGHRDRPERADSRGGRWRDWLRTGDLGFLDVTGELFITGRIKDLIIIRGINHYPQDIERTVQALHSGVPRQIAARPSRSPTRRGEEALVIVQEIERTERGRIDAAGMKGLIRESVNDQHELFARHIVLIRPGSLPKTTSGKIQRSLARKLWLERHFEDLAAGAD